MRSTRTPYRGIFSHSIQAVGNTWYTAPLSALAGNTIPMQASTNTIIIPRDGWYRCLLDTQYTNSAGSAWNTYLVQNGTNVIVIQANQNVVASWPTSSMSRTIWCKAGDRFIVQSLHNEAGSTRGIQGVITMEEVVS